MRFWACLLAMAAPVWAQSLDRIQFTIQAGAGGNIRESAITPITVLVESRDPGDLNGRLVAWFSGADRHDTRASMALEMPAGARKRVTLYLPAPWGATHINVRYENRAGRRIHQTSETVTMLGASVPALGVIGTGNVRGLPNPRMENGEWAYSSLFLQPEWLPDRFEGYEAYDVIFIHPAPEAPLSRAQIGALHEWTLRGGLLIADLSRRTALYNTPAMQSLLPIFPAAIEQRRFSIFDREALYAVGSPGDSEILLESDGVPLVVRKRYGLGAVVGFAFALDDPAFLNWPDRDAFWKAVLDVVPWTPAVSQDFMGRSSVNPAAENLSLLVSNEPSTGLRLSVVLLMTALYALAAGPGDYFLVKRLRRPRLTWITFPLIVVMFTVAAYAGAKYWVGGDWQLRHMERTAVFSDSSAGLRFDLTGFFVPRGDRYVLRDARGVYVRYIDAMSGLDDSLRIDQEDMTITQNIPIWTRRTYMSSQTLAEPPQVSIEAERDGENLAITIRNGSAIQLTVRNVLTAPALWSFPDRSIIAPGETLAINTASLRRLYYGGRMTPEPHSFARRDYQGEQADAPTGIMIHEIEGFGMRRDSARPYARELNIRPALRRGAVIVSFDALPADEPPIGIDGAVIETVSNYHLLQALTYASPADTPPWNAQPALPPELIEEL